MTKTEIAPRVFAAVSGLELAPIDGAAVDIPLQDLASLMLVPWFCEGSIQWAVRLTSPGAPFRKNSLKKVGAASAGVADDGALLVGVPGDGVRPYLTSTLVPLAEALAALAKPGTVLELATANLGVVKLDEGTFKGESASRHGDQRYLGTVAPAGRWAIERSHPRLAAAALERALACARMVVGDGPWKLEGRSEAFDVLMQWMQCKQANINPAAVKRFITLAESTFANSGLDKDRLCGLGLAFFRQRLAGAGFRWDPPDAAYVNSVNQKLMPGQDTPAEIARYLTGSA